MNRFEAETRRLYGATPAPGKSPPAQGRVAVLTFPQPAEWALVAQVWQGVQAGWSWPAPAIAVDGSGSYQLWFALAQAVPLPELRGVVVQACQRWTPDTPADRFAVFPGGATQPTWPGAQVQPERWSAFVAPDLAVLFEDTPWLDGPPNPEAQAELLARFETIAPAAWANALAGVPVLPAQGAPVPATAPTAQPVPTTAHTQPEAFLLEVMNNGAVDWRWRIEAAKALLAATRPPERP